ncbi:MAG: class I SAM-dependent methyltransferase [Myxococcota bacterium]
MSATSQISHSCTPQRGRWPREAIEDLIRRERFDYQRIELPHGLATDGEDRSSTADAIFPPDLTGRTVLDVGSNLGFFCFEAARRGARRVLGVDVDPENVRKARLLADCLGLDVEFRVLDVEKDPIGEDFDYVLAINLLHHLRNPLATIETLVERTRTRLALEVAGLGRHERRKLGLPAWRSRILGASPIVYVGRGSTSPPPPGKSRRSGFGGQRFFFSSDSLVNLLRYQRCTFARVEVEPSRHKQRYVLKADKRRIRKLVVIAGVTASGKTTLIDRLRRGEEPEIAAAIGLSTPASAVSYDAFDLIEPRSPYVDTVLFHYDILRPFRRSAHVHARDEALDVLRTADEVTVLTILPEADELVRRFDRAIIDPKRRFGMIRGGRRKLEVREILSDPARLSQWYETWFEYCRSRGIDSRVLLADEGKRIENVDVWSTRSIGDAA